VDSKKELERALKAGCEAFIMGVTRLTVDDMLSFITKVTAVKVSASSKPLREQASFLLLCCVPGSLVSARDMLSFITKSHGRQGSGVKQRAA